MIKKQVALHRNIEGGVAVFSGPKGHILLALDVEKGWEQVLFTDDDAKAQKYLGVEE